MHTHAKKKQTRPSPLYSTRPRSSYRCIRPSRSREGGHLADITQQLGLEDELALLVLLARLVGAVVLPAHRLLALLARDVPHDMPASRHAALRRLARVHVDDRVEEVGLAVLAAEVLAVGRMGLVDGPRYIYI